MFINPRVKSLNHVDDMEKGTGEVRAIFRQHWIKTHLKKDICMAWQGKNSLELFS